MVLDADSLAVEKRAGGARAAICGALGRVEAAQFLPALDQAVHGLSARGRFAVWCWSSPATPAKSSSLHQSDFLI